MKKIKTTLIITSLLILTNPVYAFPGINRGNENIRFKLSQKDGPNQGLRPPWATGDKDGTLTCEKRLGRNKAKIGNLSLPASYLAQIINFDQTVVDNQATKFGTVHRIQYGDASTQGSKGTLKTLKTQHILDLQDNRVYTVGLRARLITNRGSYNIQYVDQSETTVDSRNFEVKALCPARPRREFSAKEISDGF